MIRRLSLLALANNLEIRRDLPQRMNLLGAFFVPLLLKWLDNSSVGSHGQHLQSRF
jgi:hypothetical protein